MKCNYESTLAALKDKNLIKTKVALITGRSSSGKTTFAHEYSKNGFAVVEIDDIAKRLVNPKFNLTQDQSINIVRGKAPLEVEDYFVKKMREAIHEGLSFKGKVIVEGTMSSLRVLKKIFSEEFSDYSLIFMYPGNRSAYRQRIMKRFKQDVETGSQTLPIWDFIDRDIVESYKTDGFNSEKVSEYIEGLVERFFEGGKERYKLLKGLEKEIVTIRV